MLGFDHLDVIGDPIVDIYDGLQMFVFRRVVKHLKSLALFPLQKALVLASFMPSEKHEVNTFLVFPMRFAEYCLQNESA